MARESENIVTAGKEIRKPKKGEQVGTAQHSGVFIVVAVDANAKTAEIQLVNGDQQVKSVPWTMLHYGAPLTTEE